MLRDHHAFGPAACRAQFAAAEHQLQSYGSGYLHQPKNALQFAGSGYKNEPHRSFTWKCMKWLLSHLPEDSNNAIGMRC
jgi:hypothetical protein